MKYLIPLVAEINDRIIAYASIYKNPHPRRKNIGDLGIFIHQDYQNIGLGSKMIAILLDLAKQDKLHRVGLHVIANNRMAVHLYKKNRFIIEGVLKDSYYYGNDGKYHDEILMSIILSKDNQ